MRVQLRIVVADGSAYSRATLQQWLTQLGHHVVVVDSGVALAELLHVATLDVVICAAELLESKRFAARIRQQLALPVILLSAEWHSDRVARSLSAGGLRCFRKPVQPLELILALTELPLPRRPTQRREVFSLTN